MEMFIAFESARERLIAVVAPSMEEAYKTIARDLYGLDTSGDFDTGNVDVDLYALPKLPTHKGRCAAWLNEEDTD